MTDIQHGIPSSYNNKKCRCEECTVAWREYMRPRIKAYRQRLKDQEKKKGVNFRL